MQRINITFILKGMWGIRLLGDYFNQMETLFYIFL